MAEINLIMDAGYTPPYAEITESISEPSRALWQDLNSFIQQKYKTSPQITYSKCSAQPGWNVKYKKAGKSVCTLYPEKAGFIVLVVITLDLKTVVDAISSEFEPAVLRVIQSAKPFNGTVWLMIPVSGMAVLNNVKQLLLLKHAPVDIVQHKFML